MPQCSYQENPLPSNIRQGALSINPLPSNIRQGALINRCAVIMSCLVVHTIHKSATLQSPVGCNNHKSATLQYPVGCNNYKFATLQYLIWRKIYKSATLQSSVGCNNLFLRSSHVIIHLYPVKIRQPLCIAQNRDLYNPPCSNHVSKIILKTGM